MTESIARRTNALANHRDAANMRKLLEAMYADIGSARAGLLYGFATYDAPSLLDAAGTTTTIPVPGAVMGDFVMSVSFGVDLAGITVTGYVSANDTVSVRVQNESGGTLNLASTTIRAIVLPAGNPAASIGMLCGAKALTGYTAKADGSTTEVASIVVTGAALGDYVLVSIPLDLQGVTVTGYVASAGNVDVVLQNESGAAVTIASTTIRVRVIPNTGFGAVQAITNLVGHLSGTATYDASSLVDAAGETTTVTVTGAVLGDFAIAGHGVDAAGITITSYVSAADTVSVRVQNESGGTLNLVSATLYARVIPKSAFPITLPAQTTL